MDETIKYRVTVTNTGSTVIKNLKVEDSVSEEKTRTISSIAVNGSESVEFTHIVTEADIKEGKIVNTATADNKPSNTVETNTEDPVEKVSLNKTVTSTDADQDGKYALGETISYKVIVTNIGNQTISGVVVNDPVSEEKTKTTGTIAVNGHEDLTFTHIVTESDIAAKKVVNVATSEKGDPSNEVTTNTDDPVEKVSLNKTVTSTDADQDGKYALGETISYKVTVTNIGNQTVSGIVVNDPVSEEKTKTTGTIAVNGHEDLTFTHIVTEADIAAKKVVNVATSEKGDPSNEVTTNTDDPVEKVSLNKEVTSEDADKDGKYALGETISYKVTVTNIGNQTVSGIVVNDPVSEEKTKTTGTIAVNGHEDLTFTHIVTEADIANKKVVNVATSDKGDPSNEVTTNTDDPEEKVKMEKSVVGEDADKDGKYALGETISYKVTVTNIGNQTVSGVVVNDPVSEEKTKTTGTIAVNGHEDLTFTHVVTEADIAAKKVVNVATSDKGEPSNEVTTNTDDPKKELTADKTVTSTAQRTDGKYKLGEKVSYQVVVTNVGNQTVSGIKLSDKVNARTNIETVKRIDGTSEEDVTLSTYTFTLSPNQSATFKYDYTVTEQDVADKKVENAVIAQADGTTNGTDTETVETIELVSREVSKEWKNIDENSIPDSVDVQLYANDVICGDVKTLTKGNWNATWNELEKYDANNRIINYTVKEVNIDLTNSTLTAIENNGINGDYKVIYSVDGDKTTITNTFRKPEITVTKSQNKEQNAIVKNGDSVTYTITAENKGNKEGTVIIKDAKPENSTNVSAWLDVNENGQKDSNETTVDLEQLNSEDGYTVELGEKDTATSKVVIGYTVTADGYAGDSIINAAYYKMNANDSYNTANETCTVKIEDKMSTVAATSTTTTTTAPGHNIILVLDYSQSMANNGGYEALVPAATQFINKVLENPNNKVAIIKYSTYVIDDNPIFTSDSQTAIAKLNKRPGDYTNTDYALTKAYNLILDNNLDTSKTSVVLMTDGIPTHYFKNPTGNERSIPSNNPRGNVVASGTVFGHNSKNDISVAEAIESAGWIKESSALYTVGFGLGTPGTDNYEYAKAAIEAMATDSSYCYPDTDSSTLASAFNAIDESITENDEQAPVNTALTTNGIATITEGFAKNTDNSYVETQNVEIYTDYGTTSQARILTGSEDAEGILSMSNFLGTTYATYNSDGTISFDLGNFMRNNSIDNNKKVTIKFINIVQINRNSASRRISSANIFSMFSSNLEVDDIDENKVNEFAQKANEVEKSKKEEAVVTENNKATEETNVITDNGAEAEVEAVTDNKDEEEKVSEENTEKTEEPKDVEEKTEQESQTETNSETKSETTTEVNESEIDN